jgi:aspartyl/asparaginyl-tRNA synthetase
MAEIKDAGDRVGSVPGDPGDRVGSVPGDPGDRVGSDPGDRVGDLDSDDVKLTPFCRPKWQGQYPLVDIAQLSGGKYTDHMITLRARIVALRDSKKRSFLVVGQGDIDSVGVMVEHGVTRLLPFVPGQDPCRVLRSVGDAPMGVQVAPKLTIQSYIHIEGQVVKLRDGKVTKLANGKTSLLPYEIHASAILLVGPAPEDFVPRTSRDAGPEVQLKLRHLYLRDSDFAIRSSLYQGMVASLEHHFKTTGCERVSPPSFTSLQCEGGATLFELDAPGTSHDKPMKVYLNQSAQFYLEFELAARGTKGVYCIAPSFRAERSHTRRHLLEFEHVEAEWSDVYTIEEHADKLIQMLKCSIAHYLATQEDRLKHLQKYESTKQKLAMLDDVVMLDHKQAIQLCNRFGFLKIVTKDGKTERVPFTEDDDIPEMQERQLIDKLNKVVLLTRFHKSFKSFYMAKDPKDPDRVLGIDLEVPGVGEVVGSGIREQTVQGLQQRLKDEGLDEKTYECYTDMRKYGFAMTSGMGLGLGRLMTWLLDLNSIRQIVTWPRFPGYAAP